MKTSLSFLLFLLIPYLLFSQEKETDTIKRLYLTHQQNNQVINKYFGKLMGTGDNPDLLGNYASFDPLNGSFNFKGSMPVGSEKSKLFGFISLSLNGDISSGSYAKLFTNSKLNTNVGVQAEYHLMIGKSSTVKDVGEYAVYSYKNNLLNINKKALVQKLPESAYLQTKYKLDSIKLNVMEIELKRKKDSLNTTSQAINSLIKSNAPQTSYFKLLALDFANQSSSYDSLLKVYEPFKVKTDSIGFLVHDLYNINMGKEEEIDVKIKKKKDTLFSTLTLKGLSLNWLTILAGTSQKKYYTFDNKLPSYATQLSKEELQTYKFGLTWNSFWLDTRKKRYIYLGVGVSYGKDNNTSILSTTTITQESAYKNTVGDTTRKTSASYNAYTDPIVNTTQFAITANFYFLFGKRSSGFHLMPSFYKPRGLKNYMDLDLGYVVSFINRKKDSPAINLEAYYRFSDLYDHRNSGVDFWKRNEIGIRLGLPFAFLIK